MKKINIWLLLIIIPMVVVAQNHTPMEEKKPLIALNKKGVAINGYDTVAYFDQSKAVKGSKKYSCEYNEATWYFSSEENREKFLENPEKFAPQYGGYCAHALAEGKLIEANPKAFVVKDDKLYLYSKKKFAKKVAFTFEDKKPLRNKNWLKFQKSFGSR